MDRGFWQAILHGVSKSWTWLSDFHFHEIYKAIKNIDFDRHEVTAITVNRVWKNLCLPIVHNFHGFEKVDEESKEVFSNLVALSKKLELDLQEDDFSELLAVQHRELTNENLMELEAQRKDAERQEEEVTEELRDSQSRKWQETILSLRRHC